MPLNIIKPLTPEDCWQKMFLGNFSAWISARSSPIYPPKGIGNRTACVFPSTRIAFPSPWCRPSVVEGNFPWSFSMKFLSICVHFSRSIDPITLIWASLERSSPRDCRTELKMPILVKGDDVRSGTKANDVTAHTAFCGLSKLFEGGKLDATKFIEKVCFTTNISNLHFTVDIANKKYALKLKLL